MKKNPRPKTKDQRLKTKNQRRSSVFGLRSLVHSERGSVLVAIIWILSILSIFTVVINRRASQELLMGRWAKEQVMTRILANAGIERVLLEIQNDKILTSDAYNESWGSDEKAFKDLGLSAGKVQVICDADDRSKAGAEKTERYGACDEAARININKADELTLKNLFQAVDSTIDDTKAMEIAQSIIDWRDTDDATMQYGAESAYYEFLSTPYSAKNEKFESVEELLMVRGMTQDLYDRIKDHVTVYTEETTNFNTATSVALGAFGVSPELIQKIFEFRAGTDGIIGTKDDGVFLNVGDISAALSKIGSFSPEEFKRITDAVSTGMVDVRSDVFRIRSISRLIRNGQEVTQGVTCVINRKGHILYWNEGN